MYSENFDNTIILEEEFALTTYINSSCVIE